MTRDFQPRWAWGHSVAVVGVLQCNPEGFGCTRQVIAHPRVIAAEDIHTCLICFIRSCADDELDNDGETSAGESRDFSEDWCTARLLCLVPPEEVLQELSIPFVNINVRIIGPEVSPQHVDHAKRMSTSAWEQ